MVFTLMDSAWGLSKMGALFGLVYVLPLKGVQKGIHIFDNLPCAPTQNNVVENHLLAVQLIRLPNVFSAKRCDDRRTGTSKLGRGATHRTGPVLSQPVLSRHFAQVVLKSKTKLATLPGLSTWHLP